MAQPRFASSLHAGSSSIASAPEDNVDPLADIRLLLQFVARSFYEPRQIILFDHLVGQEAMKDEEIAARLGVNAKEVAKAANDLVRDQLVSLHLRAEVKPGASKATQRTFYYIDYKHCVDVIKWRMWRISKILDDKQRNVIDGQGYICPRCKATYSTLDISGLKMTKTSFLCEICRTPLLDNDNDIEVQKNKDRMQRLNAQTVLLKKTLQKADKAVVPPFDIAQWVAIHHPLEKAVDTPDGLAVAKGGAKEAAVSVQMAHEGNLEAKRILKEQEAEAKRKANALPVWIAQSTVSGELTGAGVRQRPTPSASSRISISKPTVSQAVNAKSVGDFDYDAYYAKVTKTQPQSGSLLSSTSPHEAKLSPSHSTSTLNSPSQSCTSLNGNNPKRPRADQEFVDEGYGSIKSSPYDNADVYRGPKKVKVEGPTMMLGGKLIHINSVTEEMELDMTPDEYQIYGSLIMAG